MEQNVAKLCRIAALRRAKGLLKGKKKFSPKSSDLLDLLGGPRFFSEKVEKGLRPGVVTGLAWTAFGGEILTIKILPLKGKGEFKITGQLGEMMNESASLAYSYVKSLLQKEIEESQTLAKMKKKKISSKDKKEKPEAPEDFLASHEIHLHLPAGATPKIGRI